MAETENDINNNTEQEEEDAGRSKTVVTPKTSDPETASKHFKPCEECGEGGNPTLHCAHCGQTLCENHRSQHIKSVIDDLKSMKQSTAAKIKIAHDRRGSIMRDLKFVEHSRSKARTQLNNQFRAHKQALEDQRRQVIAKLSQIGKPDLKMLQKDSETVENYIKDVKKTESRFVSRLGNYNPMSDQDFSSLCQDHINYTNKVNWLREYTSKPDKVKPLVYEHSSSLEEFIEQFGEIRFQDDSEKPKSQKEKQPKETRNEPKEEETPREEIDEDFQYNFNE